MFFGKHLMSGFAPFLARNRADLDVFQLIRVYFHTKTAYICHNPCQNIGPNVIGLPPLLCAGGEYNEGVRPLPSWFRFTVFQTTLTLQLYCHENEPMLGNELEMTWK